jgi:hypothetical protein
MSAEASRSKQQLQAEPHALFMACGSSAGLIHPDRLIASPK